MRVRIEITHFTTLENQLPIVMVGNLAKKYEVFERICSRRC